MFKEWLVRWHGEGADNQYMYYRCVGCGHLVTHNKIKTGGCTCFRSFKLRPAQLTISEKFRCLVLPWTV